MGEEMRWIETGAASPKTLRVKDNIKTNVETLESSGGKSRPDCLSCNFLQLFHRFSEQFLIIETGSRNQHASGRRFLHTCQVSSVEGSLRLQLPSQCQFGHGSGRVAGLRQSYSQSVVDSSGSGNQPGSPAKRSHRLRILSLPEVVATDLIVGGRHIGIQPQNLLQRDDRLVISAQVTQGQGVV